MVKQSADMIHMLSKFCAFSQERNEDDVGHPNFIAGS